MARIAVAVNDGGRWIGESHPKAKLTQSDADLMRELHEEHSIGYRKLADKFEVSKTTAKRVCQYQIHCQTPARWKFVEVRDCAKRFVLKCTNGMWTFAEEAA